LAADDLRQAAQNPVADLISLPFQNNTNFGLGKLNAQLTAYDNVVSPKPTGADWQLRSQFTFLFPTK